jgi:hypothetical protein
MLEEYGFYVLVAGALIATIAYFWLVVRAFRLRRLWGFAVLFFPPTALVFAAKHWRRSVAPFLLFVLGGLMFAAPYAASFYERHFVQLAPHERIVDGELRITLTGLKNFDYSTLQRKHETVVLQMANEDVDDHTLQYLKGMDQLRSLDLNGSQVTDEGLSILAELPRLQELRIARTRITEDGFKKHLAQKESLLKLDLTGTDVHGKTKREWKKIKPDEREYVD